MDPISSKRSLKSVIFIAASILGFVFYALFDKQIFPAASIDMKVSKKDAGEKSRAVAAQMGYSLDHVIQTTTFITDDDAKTCLEFKVGVAKANELMSAEVPVWVWRTRFCKELNKDEIYVAWTTKGQLKSIFHYFENDRKIGTVSQDKALEIAKNFVQQTANLDLNQYQLFDSGSTTQMNRTDYKFVWRKTGYPESELRIQVEVAGNQVSYYRYFLSPTNIWDREYKKIRELNELLGKIAALGVFIFVAATLGSFIHGLSTHNIRWRFALLSGAIVAVLFMANNASELNTTIDSYDLSMPFATYMFKTLAMQLLETIGVFLLSVVLAGGGETVYRSTRPAEQSLPSLFTVRGLSESSFTVKMVMGYLLVGVMMFWIFCYYKFGQSIGFFCPLGVDDYKVLGDYCPAAGGALVGVSAAGLEEFTCRVVALGLLQKWLKSFWVANLLQAVIWGFAHSTYPQQPCYARGIELTVVGLFFGYIVRNYGVIPCLVAHYLYDAFLTVEPVFASHQAMLIAPSVLVLLPFIGASVYSQWWARKNNYQAEDFTNAASKNTTTNRVQHEPEGPRDSITYAGLPVTGRFVLLGLAFVGFSTMALPPALNAFGKHKQVTVNANQALALAKKYLQEDGIDASGYTPQISLVNKPDRGDTLTWQYVMEQVGRLKAERIYDRVEPCLEWRIRYFRPSEPKEYFVYINGDGSKRCSILQDIDEGKGKKLDINQALKLVENYIDKYRPELKPYKLDTSDVTARKDRTDYNFELFAPNFNAGPTPAKIQTAVKGDQISDLVLKWDLPDNWSWPRNKQKWYQQVDYLLGSLFGGAILVLSVVWGIHIMRSTSVSWKYVLPLAAALIAASLVSDLNTIPSLMQSYNTAENFESFAGGVFAMVGTIFILSSVGVVILSIVAVSCIKVSFPQIMNEIRHGILFKPTSGAERSMRLNMVTDAAISSYSLVATLVGLRYLGSIVSEHLSPSVQLEIPDLCSAFSGFNPLLHYFSVAIQGPIFLVLLTAFEASLWKRFFNTRLRSIILILVISILIAGMSWYKQDCLDTLCFYFAVLGMIYLFVVRVFKSNWLAYVFAAVEFVQLSGLSGLLGHATAIAMPEIVMLVTFFALPLVLYTFVWLRDRGAQSEIAKSI